MCWCEGGCTRELSAGDIRWLLIDALWTLKHVVTLQQVGGRRHLQKNTKKKENVDTDQSEGCNGTQACIMQTFPQLPKG